MNKLGGTGPALECALGITVLVALECVLAIAILLTLGIVPAAAT